MSDAINALIVDDEVYAVEGIRKGVDWRAIGIEQVFCAYSMGQAIALMQQHQVDVLLCDIEMPKGSGLELLEWMTRHKRKAACIFLTSHANFSYAKTALRLGSLDYILKPVPYDQLTVALKKAVETVRQSRSQLEKAEAAVYWNKGKAHLLEQLASDLVGGSIPSKASRIRQEMRRLHLDETWLEKALIPVLLELLPAEGGEKWDASLLEYGLRNMLTELLATGGSPVLLCRLENNLFLLLLPGGGGPWSDSCREIIGLCGPVLERDINCFLGRSASLEQLAGEAARLERSRINSLSRNQLEEPLPRHRGGSLPSIPLQEWEELYAGGEIREAESRIRQYLEEVAGIKGIDRDLLRRTVQLVERSAGKLLKESGSRRWSSLFRDEAYRGREREAGQSLHGLVAWLAEVSRRLEEEAGVPPAHSQAVQQARKYIEEHLEERLTRAEIAAAAFLSPDYLSHLFKLETGHTLSEYIMYRRMEQARRLLRETDLSVLRISMEVGYSNLAYFSKVFRRCTGVTPSAYRQMPSAEQEKLPQCKGGGRGAGNADPPFECR